MNTHIIQKINYAEEFLKSKFPNIESCTYEETEPFEEHIKILFGNNVCFLRTYVGFHYNANPFTQVNFAKLLKVSIGTLKQWESGSVMPNQLSVHSIVSLCNSLLNRPNLLNEKIILFRNLVKTLPILIALYDSGISPEELIKFVDTNKLSEKLKKSIQTPKQAMLEDIIQAYPGAFGIVNKNGIITNFLISDQYLKKHPQLKNIVGKNIDEIIQDPESRKLIAKRLQKVLKSKKKISYQTTMDGYAYETNIIPIDSNKIYITALDIHDFYLDYTKQKDLWNFVLQNQPDSFFLIDKNDKYIGVWIKDEIRSVLPFPPKSFIGQTWQQVQKQIDNALGTDLYKLTELYDKIVKKTREPKSFRLEFNNLVFEHLMIPCPHGYKLGIIRNITKTYEAERKFKDLVDNIYDGVFVIQNRKFVYCNEGLAKIADCTKEELIGKDISTFAILGDKDEMVIRHLKRIQGLPAETSFDLDIISLKKKIKHVAVNVSIPVLFDGKLSIIGTARDISDRKKVFDQLEKIINSALVLLIPDSEEKRAEFLKKILEQK